MKGSSPFLGTVPTVMCSRLLPGVTGVKDCFPDASLQCRVAFFHWDDDFLWDVKLAGISDITRLFHKSLSGKIGLPVARPNQIFRASLVFIYCSRGRKEPLPHPFTTGQVLLGQCKRRWTSSFVTEWTQLVGGLQGLPEISDRFREGVGTLKASEADTQWKRTVASEQVSGDQPCISCLFSSLSLWASKPLSSQDSLSSLCAMDTGGSLDQPRFDTLPPFGAFPAFWLSDATKTVQFRYRHRRRLSCQGYHLWEWGASHARRWGLEAPRQPQGGASGGNCGCALAAQSWPGFPAHLGVREPCTIKPSLFAHVNQSWFWLLHSLDW